MTDRLYGNQGAPILITSAPSPQLPWHLSEKGAEKANPVFLCDGGRGRKWRTFLHNGCGWPSRRVADQRGNRMVTDRI